MAIPALSASQKMLTFATDAERWQGVVSRNPAAEGCFFYAVLTTGIYCRPTCPSRQPLRKNVQFFATYQAAESAGFRPCKRCQPKQLSVAQQQATAVIQACRMLETAEASPSLQDLATAVGLSKFHFQRLFKAHTGVTPKGYAAEERAKRLREHLANSESVTNLLYDAGFRSSGRFYATANQTLGMTPTTYRAGGAGVAIRFAVGQCWLGAILVALSQVGVCAILLGDDPELLLRDLQERFPQAQFVGADRPFEAQMAQILGFLQTPERGLHLPLDIRGTAFQRRVWEALRQIPAGSTLTYTQLAQKIGHPQGVRAVANACAANAHAVAIPCHRVIRLDGSLSGYRWGIARKEQLLQREAAQVKALPIVTPPADLKGRNPSSRSE